MSSFSVKNKELILKQPDGTTIRVCIGGTEIDLIFETLDGFSVIKNSETGIYEYADVCQKNGILLTTGIAAGTGDPVTMGLPRNLRQSNGSGIKKKSRWEIRRERAKQLNDLLTTPDLFFSEAHFHDFTIGTLENKERHIFFGESHFHPSRNAHRRTGNYLGLCLLVDFRDSPRHPLMSCAVLDDYCNLRGYTGFQNKGSVFDYFYDNSGGKLLYTNRVLDYYRASKNKTYYRDFPYPLGAQMLVAEALDWAKRNYDLSGLSTDDDDCVFAVSLMYAGRGDDDPEEGLSAHQHHLETPLELMPGMLACDYQICPMEYELTLGTFCHETGHLICNFPDLYDRGGQSYGIGDFCLMARGNSPRNPAQINAYLKYQAGWAANAVEINGEINPQINAGTNDFFIHRNAGNAAEYFIIENRHKSGRDLSLPGSGLAIWHVDERVEGNENSGINPNEPHYECSLEQADGIFQLERRNNDGDAGDLFSSQSVNRRFGKDTTPNSRWWDGTASNLEIDNISAAGSTMTFRARVAPNPT